MAEQADMECRVRWSGEGMSFLAETGSNHLVSMDGAPDGGGRNLAPRPMEMVLVGTGGGCEVALTASRADADPKVFTQIHMRFTVRGRGLKRNLVEHAVRLSHEKYCSASIMLGKTAEITKEVEIVEG